MLFFLTLRDIKLRYKQTVMGVAWAVIQPLFTMAVFALFFGKLAKMPSDGKPYSLFVLAALLPWQLFSYALTQSSGSLVSEQRLITKVYFPRLIIPLSSVLSGLLDFLVAFALFFCVLGAETAAGSLAVPLSWRIATLPIFIGFTLVTALSVGLWLGALNVQYRDVRYTIPFLNQLWMFLTPIAYPSSIVPRQYLWIYGLNPLTSIVEGFRWALLGTDSPDWAMMAVSGCTVVALGITALYYFRRLEGTFADVV